MDVSQGADATNNEARSLKLAASSESKGGGNFVFRDPCIQGLIRDTQIRKMLGGHTHALAFIAADEQAAFPGIYDLVIQPFFTL